MELFAPWHIAILVIVALLVFGPRKLPEIGSSLGKSITSFRKAMSGVEEEARAAVAPQAAAADAAAEVQPAVATEMSATAPIEPEAAMVSAETPAE